MTVAARNLVWSTPVTYGREQGSKDMQYLDVTCIGNGDHDKALKGVESSSEQ